MDVFLHPYINPTIHPQIHLCIHTIRPVRLSEGQSYTPYASILPKYALNIYRPKWRKADLQACRHPGTDFPGSKLRFQGTPTRNSWYGRKPLWYQEVPWKYLMDIMHQFVGFIISTSAGLTCKINRQVSFRFQSYLSGKDLESLNIEKFGHRRFKSLATGTVGEILFTTLAVELHKLVGKKTNRWSYCLHMFALSHWNHWYFEEW